MADPGGPQYGRGARPYDYGVPNDDDYDHLYGGQDNGQAGYGYPQQGQGDPYDGYAYGNGAPYGNGASYGNGAAYGSASSGYPPGSDGYPAGGGYGTDQGYPQGNGTGAPAGNGYADQNGAGYGGYDYGTNGYSGGSAYPDNPAYPDNTAYPSGTAYSNGNGTGSGYGGSYDSEYDPLFGSNVPYGGGYGTGAPAGNGYAGQNGGGYGSAGATGASGLSDVSGAGGTSGANGAYGGYGGQYEYADPYDYSGTGPGAGQPSGYPGQGYPAQPGGWAVQENGTGLMPGPPQDMGPGTARLTSPTTPGPGGPYGQQAAMGTATAPLIPSAPAPSDAFGATSPGPDPGPFPAPDASYLFPDPDADYLDFDTGYLDFEAEPPPEEAPPLRGPGEGRASRRRAAKRIKRRRRLSATKEVPILISVALLIALVLKTFLVQAFVIPSGSMEQTIKIGDRVLVDKLTPWFGSKPERGDVVVFSDPGGWLAGEETQKKDDPVGVKQAKGLLTFIGLLPSDDEQDLIKRLIAKGGDRVKCCDSQGRVTVNGTPLKEPYLHPGNKPSQLKFDVTVPIGRVFVMGDHRANSADSRFHLDDSGKGTVPEGRVVGRAVVIAWPFDHWRKLEERSTYASVADPGGAGTSASGSGDNQVTRLPLPAELPLVMGVVGLYRMTYRQRRGVRSDGGGLGGWRTVRLRRWRKRS